MADLDPCQCGLFHVTTVNGRQEPAVWLVREAGETLYQGAIYLGKDGKVYQSRPSEIAK